MVPTMNKSNYWYIGLLLAAFAFAGCKKAQQEAPVPEFNGVKVNYPKLQQAFANSSPELQQGVRDLIQGLRYGMYEKSLEALDKMSSDTSLTDEQKKVVNELIEQVKTLASKAPPPSQ